MSDPSKPATDMMRLLSDFRMPSMPDVESLAAAQRRNFEALSAANRIALEGAQAVAKRHMEILQQSMAELTDAMRSASTTANPQERAASQAELVKATYGRAVTNMQEIADLIQKSNGEALALLHKRFAEAMDEVKGLIAKNGGNVPPV